MRIRDAPLCKLLILVWVLAAVFVWTEMLLKDFWNFLLLGALGTIGLYFLLWVLRKGVLKKLGFPLSSGEVYTLSEHRNVSIFTSLLFSFACISGFFYASVISGDWTGIVGVPHACFGNIHLHHSMTFGITLIVLLFIFDCKDTRKFKFYSKLAFCIGFALVMALSGFTISHGLPRHTGFWLVFSIFALFYFALAAVLRNKEVFSVWFFVLMTINVGIAFGVTFEGILFGIPDLPDSIIIYDPVGCGAFRANL